MSRSDCSPITLRSIQKRQLAAYLISAAGLVSGVVGTASAAPTKASGQTSGVSNSGSVADAQNVGINKPMRVKMGKTSSEFIVATPKAKVSTATRVVNPAAPQHNVVREVYAELLVSTANEQTLARALQSATRELGTDVPGSHTYRPYLDLQDTFVVEALSVEDAINLANRLENMEGVNWAEISYREPLVNMGAPTITSDPNAPFQWHVFNDPGLFAAPFDGNHFIDQAYARGYSGAGVTVGVLEAFQNSFYRVDNDNNLEIHPDLALKTNFALSRTTDPFHNFYSHGVSVAGLIGAEGNNGIHGAGVAYNSQLVSLRNGSTIDQGESLGWAINAIDIINNSWGPDNESFPGDSTGKYLVTFPDDYEIDVPQVVSGNFGRAVEIGLDRGIRLGRAREGRIYVFSAGNSNHFQGFDRLAVGNAISLPGIGPDPMADPYGYLDISSLDPADNDGDGIPDTFNIDGAIDLGWRWSGHLGGRTEYNPYASLSRTIAIGSVGQSRAASGYSTTGTSVFVSAYSQDSVIAPEFSPPPDNAWFAAAFGLGLVTIEQEDTVDSDLAGFGVDCNAVIPGLAFTDDDIESCMFNGTSAAAPVASGIIALMLEANPSLSLRDIQAILQRTAIVPETTGADPAGSDFYDTTKTYWPNPFFGLGSRDPDDSGPTSPTFWTTNSAGIRHSDEYGFGIIDASAAVQLAETWPGVRHLVLLDSGTKTAGDDEGNPFFTDGMIVDATFEQAAVISENLETNVLVPGDLFTLQLACVRDNIEVEGVELELTITGDGAGDLMIALIGPRGTVSPLAIPRGDSNGLNGTAYFEHTFTTYKHWGELSGGTWTLVIQDFRPDEESPEGEPPDEMPDPMDPSSFGIEQVTYLGTFGLPGNPDHDEKELVSYRLKIFGQEIGADVYEACPPLLTGCPGDLDGNGVIDLIDLQIFISWYIAFDTRADFNGDGNIDYLDVVAYRTIWVPGFCNGNTGYIGGRPRPGTTDLGDNDPQTRPI